MKRLSLAYALACLLAGAAAPAFAQAGAGVADPQAAVPATTYRPAIHPSAAPAPAASPDQAWRTANATVGGRNPMSLTMPGMGGQHDMSGHDTGSHEMSGHDMHGAHAGGMPMQAQSGQAGAGGMQCMSGGGGCCGGGNAPAAGHAGMTMGAAASGQQCMAGGDGKGCCADKDCCGDKGCCADKPGAGDHAGHAGMAMDHGCCAHEEAK